MKLTTRLIALTLLLLTAGVGAEEKPMETVPQVDLPRFMGDWYVIANIPTFIEKGAHNAVESYALNPDGTIATTFRFHKGAFDGPEKVYHPTGFVVPNTGNALWGMQFIWPFKAEYMVIRLDPEYSITVIGRTARDYVWVMARQPEIPEAKLTEIMAFLKGVGYDTALVQRVPQRW
ncbi:MAG: lipocalin family protein [Lamprocystis purpurea]|jgi:apolipoprotein D and lipocalin family protein|uniref:lipocalin family protein n=1 Tax=Lamprocystis purpurea TaxID=61598 RepID=UPI000370A0C0|nr:lipocalin family protein [Lamprocystis purpurea]MBV5275125.1 lipocalin family protein [Lamprocystis purpurea]